VDEDGAYGLQDAPLELRFIDLWRRTGHFHIAVPLLCCTVRGTRAGTARRVPTPLVDGKSRGAWGLWGERQEERGMHAVASQRGGVHRPASPRRSAVSHQPSTLGLQRSADPGGSVGSGRGCRLAPV
jgi:hypothetical protein